VDETTGLTEYLVVALERDSGRPCPPFIVPARDEETARRLSQRRYLVLRSVERYVHLAGTTKPKVYRMGPPVSDRTFEQDYHNRPADPDSRAGVSEEQVAEGGLLVLRILLRVFRVFSG
jgi:hypothetical protein